MIEEAVAKALATIRGRSFWFAGGLALLLGGLSWTNLWLVRGFNRVLFQQASLDPAGWWMYLGLRLPISALLVWVIVRFPQTTNAAQAARKQKAVQADGRRLFDPLMGLRALACILVMMGHYFLVVFPFVPTPRTRVIGGLLHANPWAGVWVFFTLSGYLMGKAFTRGRYALDEAGSRSFLRNRMLRIAPVYYGAIVVVGLLRFPTLFAWRNGWMLLEMLIFDFRGDLPIHGIGALWSVSAEVQFYLLVPLLMVAVMQIHRRLGRTFPLFVLVLLAAGTGFRFFINRYLDMPTYGYTPLFGNLDIFVVGLSINLLPRWKAVPVSLIKRRGPVLLLAAAGIYGFLSLLYADRHVLHMEALEVFWTRATWMAVVCAGTFIYFAELAGPLEVRRGPAGWFLRTVEWIGTLTYCLYVFHSDVFLSMATVLPKVKTMWDSLAYFPMVMAQTFAVAAFFYYLVERPFERRKKVPGTAVLDAP